MTTCADDKVYLDLMNQRTQRDKEQLMTYNCVNFERQYPQGLVSMLPPQNRASFSGKQLVNPAALYQLNPTPESIKMAGTVSSSKNVFPPSCGFANVPQGLCAKQTPYSYPNLEYAYNPTSGSKCINYGQDLNLQYVQK